MTFAMQPLLTALTGNELACEFDEKIATVEAAIDGTER